MPLITSTAMSTLANVGAKMAANKLFTNNNVAGSVAR